MTAADGGGTTRSILPPAAAIVLAAGRSERLAGGVPKPFRLLGGRRMVDYSLAAFAAVDAVASIVVAVPPGLTHELRAAVAALPKVSGVVDGGTARQDSLARALAAVPADVEIVAVHDAARPLVTREVVGAVLAALAGADGAIAAIPLDDAVKDVGEGGEIRGPRSRVGLWRAQTPQAFRRGCLEEALRRALADGVVCDDCSEMATRIGYRVVVVPGNPRNLKVTREADLALCEALLAAGGEP